MMISLLSLRQEYNMKNLVDLHTHSVFSKHAYSTVTENIDEALKKGLIFYGISDHQPDRFDFGANKNSFLNLGVIPDRIGDLRILKGCEMNAGEYFNDWAPFFNERVDYLIASIHTYDHGLKHSITENTNFYLEAIRHPLVKILGHLDDGNHLSDYDVVIKECLKQKVLVELNNSSLSPNGCRLNSYENMSKMITICKDINCPVILNSDAHIRYDVGNVDRAYNLAHELGLKDELIANINTDILIDYFDIK